MNRRPPGEGPRPELSPPFAGELGFPGADTQHPRGDLPATWEQQGDVLTLLGTCVTISSLHLQKNITQKHTALGTAFPDVPTTRSPRPTEPQGTGHVLCFI